MKALPEALSELMALRGMNQTELAAATGLTDATISYYLRGSRGREMSATVLDTLQRISDALQVSLDHWLEYRVWRVQEIARQNPSLADEVYDLLVAYAEREGSERGKGPAK